MTSTILDTIPTEKKAGFISSLFNKITAPLRDWVNEVQQQYEDAKIRVETGSTPISSTQKIENKEAHLKHIVKNVYFRDVVEDNPESLRASIQQFYDDNGGGFDVEEVARYAETIPISDREKITPEYLKNPDLNPDLAP